MTGSNLCTLRSGASAPSSSALQLRRRTSPARRPRWPIVTSTSPTSSPTAQEQAVRVARAVHQPDQAEHQHDAAVEGEVALRDRGRCRPATSASTYGTQLEVPRSASNSVVGNVVTDGGLDEVEERRAVGAQHEQRHQPPQRAEQREQPATRASGCAGADPGSRVSSQSAPSGSTANVAAALTPPTIATARAEQRRRPARGAARGADDQRQQHPRAPGRSARPRSRSGPACVSIRGDRAKAKPATRQARSDRTPSARASRAVADEGDAQDQRQPEPLDHPAGQVERAWPEREERAHRPQVAVGLVLQLAERALGVPQVQRPGRGSPTGSTARSNLVSATRKPGDLDEGEPDQQHARPRAQPRARTLTPSLGHRLRSTSTRFHVTTSRSRGTRSSHQRPARVVARQHVRRRRPSCWPRAQRRPSRDGDARTATRRTCSWARGRARARSGAGPGGRRGSARARSRGRPTGRTRRCS